MKLLLRFLVCLALASPVPGLAQTDRAQDVIAQLQTEGFTVSEVRRSWLGRILITAHDGTDLREVVLNRTSGEILRDRLFPNAHLTEHPAPPPEEARPASSGGGRPDTRNGTGPGPGGPGSGGGPGGGPGGGGPGGKE